MTQSADSAVREALDEMEAGIRATICPTFKFVEGMMIESNEGRISKDWCDQLFVIARKALASPEAPAAVDENAKLHAEIERLEKLVYVPGLLKCKKCGFALIKTTLYVKTGNFGADNSPDHCPNDGAPLWRVTERDAGNEQIDIAEKMSDELRALRAKERRFTFVQSCAALNEPHECAGSEGVHDIAPAQFATPPAPQGTAALDEDHIKHMVDRFLGWKLPEHFNPDDGISFDPISNKGYVFERRREPTGTNLFNADQATEMVRHMVKGIATPQPDKEAVMRETIAIIEHEASLASHMAMNWRNKPCRDRRDEEDYERHARECDREKDTLKRLASLVRAQSPTPAKEDGR